MRTTKKFTLWISDVLELTDAQELTVNGVRLDAKISVGLVRYGEDGEPELDSCTEVGPVYLRHEYLTEPVLLDETNLRTVHKGLYEDFVAFAEGIALLYARSPKAAWNYDDEISVGDAGDERD